MHPPISSEFGLILFSIDEKLVRPAVDAGVDGIMVDWENQAKKARQKDFDTEINLHTFDDLCRLRHMVPPGKLICRVNGFNGDQTFREADLAVKGGADEIFLPMVTSAGQVKALLDHCGNAVAVSILIETTAALDCLAALSELPLNRVYVGLNDLHIQQATPNLFYPMTDGTVANIRRHFSQPLGLGGVTHPAGGKPITSHELIKAYAQLSVNFSFLRRTFVSDCRRFEVSEIINAIREAYKAARSTAPEVAEADFQMLCNDIRQWENHPHRA